MRARLVAAGNEFRAAGSDLFERLDDILAAAQSGRIARRADDDEVVVHDIAP